LRIMGTGANLKMKGKKSEFPAPLIPMLSENSRTVQRLDKNLSMIALSDLMCYP